MEVVESRATWHSLKRKFKKKLTKMLNFSRNVMTHASILG